MADQQPAVIRPELKESEYRKTCRKATRRKLVASTENHLSFLIKKIVQCYEVLIIMKYYTVNYTSEIFQISTDFAGTTPRNLAFFGVRGHVLIR